MKKIVELIVVSVFGIMSVVSCQKGSQPGGVDYTVEIAANKYAAAVATSHVVFERDASGQLVGTHTLSATETGVKKSFKASPEAAYVTVRMDMEAKPSTGSRKSFFYSYMFILESGKTNTIALDGTSSVQETEPVIRN